jgi:hypothetical protein
MTDGNFEPLDPGRLLFSTPCGCMILIFAGAGIAFVGYGLSYFLL